MSEIILKYKLPTDKEFQKLDFSFRDSDAIPRARKT